MTTTTRLRTVVGVTFLAQLGLLLWSRTLSPLVLVLAGALLVGAVIGWWGERREERLAVPLAQAALALALLAALATTARLEWGSRHWEQVAATREDHLVARLGDRLGGVMRRAQSAAAEAAEVEPPGFDRLEAIRSRADVDAVALLDDRGVALGWAGDHRGRIPPDVYEGDQDVVFPGGTLFDYLYVVAPTSNGLRAVAAELIQAGPPLRGATRSVAGGFERVSGERPTFLGPAAEGADWQLRADGRVVMSARFPPLSHGEWRGRVARTGRRVLFGLVLVALGLLSATWLRTLRDIRGAGGMVPMAALSITLMATPLRRTLGLDQLFSPAWFMLPTPGDFVIEGVMVVLLPLAALLSTLRPSPGRRGDLWLRLAISAALVGGGFAAGISVMTGSAGAPMLRSGGSLWYVLQPTTVVLLTILVALLTPGSAQPDDRRRLLAWAGGGVAASVGLALGVAGTWRPDAPLPTAALFLWAIPFFFLARAVAGYAGRGDRLLRWLAAGWLAATAVIPHMWVANQAARLTGAEADVTSFGARGDPFLTYLLGQFDEALQASAARGEQGVDLLYDAWVSSELASEPYPVAISLWDGDLRQEAYLPLGVRLEPAGQAQRDLLDVVGRVMTTGVTENVPATGGGISRILAVPLGGGAVSVSVAPRASLRPTSALTMFMEGEPHRNVTLDLLPAIAFQTPSDSSIRWQKSDEGWGAETLLREGNDIYHAHLGLHLPPAGVRLARGVLLITLDLLLLTLLWVLGRVMRGDPPVPPGGWVGWLAGFRARLTVALFAFFLLPTAVFGWAAYRALADEVTRAARQVAERSVVQAAAVLPGAGLMETARRTGEDLLYYREGMLGAASIPEAVELGLYSAWMPPQLFQGIRDGELLGGTETGELANRGYLVAYRRLRSPVEMLAVPVWLAARDVAVRQREFAHLVLFGVLVGGVLSLALSVMVGRALSQPIGELRRAAAVVGRGQLRVRLPEQRADEFGELFASFNQMTRRLRKARAQELRTARILAWGEMARQVAHEIKNPLTPIKLSIQHIRRAHQDRHEDFDAILESNVEQILEEIERLTEISKAFSRYGAPKEAAGATERVDVAAIARDVMTLYRAPDRSVTYRLVVDGQDTVAGARASELREVIVNLLENARAAVGKAGRVEVRVEGRGSDVRLSVRDDGKGISPEQLPRIFEPHFSTRSSGTGLGLAIVRRLVESWGGTVGAESELEQGAVVWLTVPKGETAPARQKGTDAVAGEET